MFKKIPRAISTHKYPSDGKPLVQDLVLLKLEDILKALDSSIDGISRSKARLKRIKHGPNKIASEKPSVWYLQLLGAFNTPFNYILLALATLAIISSDFKAAIVISFMVATSGLLRFWQEFRSSLAAEKLRTLVHTVVSVSRPQPGLSSASRSLNGSMPFESNNQSLIEDIPIQELVPGDMVHLSAGDLVPGDMILFWAKDLFINQSTLSGESIPVEKTI